MTWFKVDDGWLMHPKVRAAGLRGRALWLSGGLHCASQLTDGLIAKRDVPILAAQAEVPASAAKALVACGLWVDEGDHYRMHDYLDFQPSRADVLAQRAAAAERQRRARSRAKDDTTPPDNHASSHGVTDGVSNGPPDPTRPDPTNCVNGFPTNPTSAVGGSTGGGGVVDQVITAMVRAERDAERGVVRNEQTWATKVRSRLVAEWGPTITELADGGRTACDVLHAMHGYEHAIAAMARTPREAS